MKLSHLWNLFTTDDEKLTNYMRQLREEKRSSQFVAEPGLRPNDANIGRIPTETSIASCCSPRLANDCCGTLMKASNSDTTVGAVLPCIYYLRFNGGMQKLLVIIFRITVAQ